MNPPLVDIDTQALSDEALIFIDCELKAQAKYAVHVAPTVIHFAEHYDVLVLCKNSLLTDAESELLSETVSKIRYIRDINNRPKLPLFYLHKADDSSSPEADKAVYQANCEVLNALLGDDVPTFGCDALSSSEDSEYERFKEQWHQLRAIQSAAFITEFWTPFRSTVTTLKEEYQLFIQKIDGVSNFQTHLEAYNKICREHPDKDFYRAWEDVGTVARTKVVKAFTGNNGSNTLYDLALKDMPENTSTTDWDRWQTRKNIEVLEAFLDFIIALFTFLHSEYQRVKADQHQGLFKKLSEAGLLSDLPSSKVEMIQGQVDEDVRLRELDPNLTSSVEVCFRYGFMISILGSLAVSAFSGIATLIAAWKGGSEAAAATAPLGPIPATIAFLVGAGVGAFVANRMINSADTKQWRAEAQKEMARYLNALQAEASKTREEIWTQYKRMLEDDLETLHASMRDLLTEQSNISEGLSNLTPEEISELRPKKQAVINACDAVLACKTRE